MEIVSLILKREMKDKAMILDVMLICEKWHGRGYLGRVFQIRST